MKFLLNNVHNFESLIFRNFSREKSVEFVKKFVFSAIFADITRNGCE